MRIDYVPGDDDVAALSESSFLLSVEGIHEGRIQVLVVKEPGENGHIGHESVVWGAVRANESGGVAPDKGDIPVQRRIKTVDVFALYSHGQLANQHTSLHSRRDHGFVRGLGRRSVEWRDSCGKQSDLEKRSCRGLD